MTVKPEISVCIFSYNFGKYIEQALDSVLAQKLSVPFEIVIGDDNSTDNSKEIICRYQKLYPNLIRAGLNTENVEGTRNWLNTINECRGKYIAFLDGDDYFIDEQKLQKQYNILEKHEEYALCFHGVREMYEDLPGETKTTEFKKEVFTLADVIRKGWFIRTGSLFFRNHILPDPMPEWIYDYPYRLDSILPVMLCMHGDASYTNDVMSVWRKHSKGMSYHLHENEINNSIVKLSLAKKLDDLTAGRFRTETSSNMAKIYTSLFVAIFRSGDLIRHRKMIFESIVKMDYGHLFSLLTSKHVDD